MPQRPLAENLSDSICNYPNVRGKGERLVRESGLGWLKERKGPREPDRLVRVERFSKVAKSDLLFAKNTIIAVSSPLFVI